VNYSEEGDQTQPHSRLHHNYENMTMSHNIADHSMSSHPAYPNSMPGEHAVRSQHQENKDNARINPDFVVPIPKEKKKERKGR
jgi:hypothetical protein